MFFSFDLGIAVCLFPLFSPNVLPVSNCIPLTKLLIVFSFQNMLRGHAKGVSISKHLFS